MNRGGEKMNFKKEFPSLDGYQYPPYNIRGDRIRPMELCFCVSDIQKHCIDKEKLIEFLAIIRPNPRIMKQKLTDREIKNFQLHWNMIVKLAGKELGL